MSVPDKNLTKWILLVQRSETLIDYHTHCSSLPISFIRQSMQERERQRDRETERQRDRGRDRERHKESRYNYESMFLWKEKKNTSS